VDGIGMFIDAQNGPVVAGNMFANVTAESCYNGFVIQGTSLNNTFISPWTEGNTVNDVIYSLPGGDPTAQSDTWINHYQGATIRPVTHSPYNTLIEASRTFSRVYESGTGYKFPAVPVPSADPNTLDAYKENIEWSPEIDRNAGTWDGVIGPVVGSGIKIGRQVTLYGKIPITSVSVNSTGVNVVKTLPFAAAENVYCTGAVTYDSALTSQIKAVRAVGSLLYFVDANGADVNENWIAGTIEFSITYIAAA
jgi:hypothetical protein